MATQLDPQLISAFRKADTIVFHQRADELEGDGVIYDRRRDITIDFTVDNGGRHASLLLRHGQAMVEAVESVKNLRVVSKLEKYDLGTSETIISLMRQGDTLRVYNDIGGGNTERLSAAGLLTLRSYLIIKRRRKDSDGHMGGRELKFLIGSGVFVPAHALQAGCIAI